MNNTESFLEYEKLELMEVETRDRNQMSLEELKNLVERQISIDEIKDIQIRKPVNLIS